ncbi:MAG: hypothetical protein JNL08_16635 [Planctomycetes bacterium]|nr:hypothetical protein [Planctomycetota bacterium]
MTRTGLQSYSESISRDLFTACDADSDDRLDVFEASDALDAIAGPKDSAGFQRYDTDRDGFVSWLEFDQQFWDTAQRGSTFRVRPCRNLGESTVERQQAQTLSPLQAFLRMHDKNGNGALDPDEVEAIVTTAGLQPTVGTQLRAQDRDRSGRIDEAELAPWFEQLRGMLPGTVGAADPARGSLPAPWQAGDRDGNGRLDAAELADLLRRLDPMLARWAEHLVRALDRDGDNALDHKELPVPETPSRHGPALRHPSGSGTTPGRTLSRATAEPTLVPTSR